MAAKKPNKDPAADPKKKTTAGGSTTKPKKEDLVKSANVQLQPAVIESIIRTVQDLAIVSKYACESDFFVGLDTPAKASMVIEKGRELGIHTVSACQVIHPIKTQDGIKLAIESKLYAAIAMNSGVRWTIHEKTPEGCKLELYSIKDKTIPNHTDTFTMKDAARAKLHTKNNWLWYPEEMCYWRCFIKNCRIFDARICMGLYSVQEVNDFDKITNGEGEEIYVIPEETLSSVGIPTTDTAPTQTVAEALPAEAEVQTVPAPVVETESIQEDEHPEGEYFNEAEDVPDEALEGVAEDEALRTDGADTRIMPFDTEDPTAQEQKPGTRELAPKVPTDPGILIHKQVVLDFIKVQGFAHLYPTFKNWLSVFQTSRQPMKNFVGRNQFGKWSLEKGKIEDLKVLTDNLKWTMDMFIDYCFKELKLAEVGIHTNPALNVKPE